MPVFSKLPLPDLGPCPKRGCRSKECTEHCKNPLKTRGPKAYQHEVDVQFLGWAKGYGDGTFDVTCVRCGEVGSIEYIPEHGDIDWD